MTIEHMIERAALDEQFQAACQRYAHGNGSSQAVAAAALRAAGASELLEALQSIVSECDGPDRPYSIDSYLPPMFLSVARTAIARAKRKIGRASCRARACQYV